MTNQAWLMLCAIFVQPLPMTAYAGITASVNLLIIIVPVFVIIADIVIVTAFLTLRGRKKRAHEQMNQRRRL